MYAVFTNILYYIQKYCGKFSFKIQIIWQKVGIIIAVSWNVLRNVKA